MDDSPRFELHESLGSGSFGEVFRAHMVSSGGVRIEVAVKLLQPELDPQSQALERLLDEGRLLGLLDHPAILKVHDLVQIADRVGLVTEYVDGEDLEFIIRGGGMPLRPLLEVTRQIASAISCAWHTDAPDKGGPLQLVHRDIKPANIRIGRHGQPKLLDFGVAKAIHVPRDTNTNNESMIGSYLYMPPERLTRTEGHSNAGDLYALGAVVFEGIRGKALFSEISLHEQFTLAWDAPQHDAFIRDQLDQLNVDSSVRSVIEVLLRHRPESRGTAADVVRRCDALDQRLPGPRLRAWCRKRDWTSEPEDLEPGLGSRTITDSVITGSIDTDRFRRTSNERVDFVGRGAETARLLSLMGPGLTLIHGPGGIGKSRMAREQCRDPEQHVFVAAEQAESPRSLVQAIAAALQVPLASPDEAGQLAQLCESLTARKLQRLVLDNLEQLETEAYRVIEQLHQRIPRTCILMTSRLTVPIRGVRVLTLGPLDTPSGVSLYLQRAKAVAPNFTVNAAEEKAIGAFVEAVGGMPLAIELAASRCRLLPPEELGSWEQLGRLAGNAPQHAARSIDECLDASWNLLTPDEQNGWLAMAHFVGSFTTTAWAAVADLDQPLDTLDALISHSLVLAPAQGKQRRFSLMPPIRRYLDQRLQAHPRRAEGQRALCRYYSAQARKRMPQIRTTEHLRWAQAERGNLMRVSATAVDFDPEQAGWSLCALSQLIQDQGPTQALIDLGRPILKALTESTPLALRVQLTLQVGLAYARLGSRAKAHACAEAATRLAADEDDLYQQAECRHMLGVIAYLSGEADQAVTLMRDATTVALAAGHALMAGLSQYNLASLLEFQSRRTEALHAAHMAISHLSECDAPVARLGAYTLVAALELEVDNVATAERAFEQGQALMDMPVGRVTLMFETNRALMMLRQSKPHQALELLEEQYEVALHIGLADARAAIEWARGLAFFVLDDLILSQQSLETSRETYARSQQQGESHWVRVLVGSVMRIRGQVDAGDYELQWAAREAQDAQATSRPRVLFAVADLLGDRAPAWLTQAVGDLPPEMNVRLTGPVAAILKGGKAASAPA